MADTKDQVDAPGVVYTRMAEHWPLIDALGRGTKGMREKKEEFLPREQGEELRAYEARLDRTYLFNAFGATVDNVVGKPFSEAVTIAPEAEGMPEMLAEIHEDVDLGGRDLTEFASDVFRGGVSHGIHYVLVDMPRMGGGLSLQDERDVGVRPFFIDVPAEDLLGFKSTRLGNGEEVLTQVRIRERQVEATGQFTEDEVEYVRVINAPGFGFLPVPEDSEISPIPLSDPEDPSSPLLGTWELWRRDNDGEFKLFTFGTHDYPGPGLPITPFYSERVAFMEAEPPLRDLAEQNLKHWQTSSDQSNILHFVRLAFLMIKGVTKQEAKGGIVFSANRAYLTTNTDADGKYIEHSGRGIEAGRQDLLDTEEKMVVLGMTPFMRQQGGQRTRVGDEAVTGRTTTQIQAWIRNLVATLTRAYEIAATWAGAELPPDFKIDVFDDFGMSQTTELSITALLSMRAQKQITHERFLMEAKRLGFLGDDLDIEEELRRLDLESPRLDDPPPPPLDPDDDEEDDDDD